MTGFTVIAGIDMAGVFAGGSTAVMAAFTCANNLCMVNLGCRSPVAVYVTAFTTVGGVDMCAVFASGNGAVVTAGTVGCIGWVNKGCIGPAAIWIVAVHAGITAGNMVG